MLEYQASEQITNELMMKILIRIIKLQSVGMPYIDQFTGLLLPYQVATANLT